MSESSYADIADLQALNPEILLKDDAVSRIVDGWSSLA
jgi:hypothetical protein